jgi:hypothetical protein
MSKNPLILFYSTFFSKPVDIGSIPYDGPGGFTLDKRRIAEATAVVFHIPNYREIGDAFKYPGQYWVGWTMESRQNYKRFNDPKFMRHFDFTMTHDTRSEIWTPYIPIKNWWDEVMAMPVPAKTETVPLALFVSKSKSNHSGRMDLIEGLWEHIPIDSYGRFKRNRTIEPPDLGSRSKLAAIGRYKFGFAFENSKEPDYVTEKIYDCFKAGTVPIYLGAPNIAEFAPPGSYINADDFGSARELADYLKYLIETPQAYEAFFAWRTKPLPDFLAEKIRVLETPLFIRLLDFIRQETDSRPSNPAGRRGLPFGRREYLSTRLRKWKKKVPR